MTGKAILEAMSFVEDKYIDEAENRTLQGGMVIRRLLPLAACICLIIVGMHFGGFPGADETAPEMENAAVIQETGAAPEMNIIDSYHKDHSITDEADIALDQAEAIWVGEVPSVILRIEAWTDTGFAAVVEGKVDTDILPIGTAVQVEILPNIVIETVKGDIVYAQRRMPTEGDFPVGSLVRVMFRTDPGDSSILRIESIRKERE